jgi:hypothetical protein
VKKAYIHDRPHNPAYNQAHTAHWWDVAHMGAELVSCKSLFNGEQLTAVLTLIYSPIPLTRAAWWKYPATIHFLDHQHVLRGADHDSPDNVPICTARQDLHLLSLHDILKLTPDLSGFPHQLRVKEVLHTPAIVVTTHQCQQS